MTELKTLKDLVMSYQQDLKTKIITNLEMLIFLYWGAFMFLLGLLVGRMI